MIIQENSDHNSRPQLACRATNAGANPPEAGATSTHAGKSGNLLALFRAARPDHQDDAAEAEDLLIAPMAVQALTMEVLGREPLVIGLTRDHRLARQKLLFLDDVRGEPLIWWPRNFNPLLFDWLFATCTSAAGALQIVQEATTLPESLDYRSLDGRFSQVSSSAMKSVPLAWSATTIFHIS